MKEDKQKQFNFDVQKEPVLSKYVAVESDNLCIRFCLGKNAIRGNKHIASRGLDNLFKSLFLYLEVNRDPWESDARPPTMHSLVKTVKKTAKKLRAEEKRDILIFMTDIWQGIV